MVSAMLPSFRSSLLDGLRTLFEQQLFCDVVLRFSDSKISIQCHSVVLASMSSLFARIIGENFCPCDEQLSIILADPGCDGDFFGFLNSVYQNLGGDGCPQIHIPASIREYFDLQGTPSDKGTTSDQQSLNSDDPFVPLHHFLSVGVNDTDNDNDVTNDVMDDDVSDAPAKEKSEDDDEVLEERTAKRRKKRKETKVKAKRTRKEALDEDMFDYDDDEDILKEPFDPKLRELTSDLLQRDELILKVGKTADSNCFVQRTKSMRDLKLRYVHAILAFADTVVDNTVEATAIVVDHTLRDADAAMEVYLDVLKRLCQISTKDVMGTPSLKSGKRKGADFSSDGATDTTWYQYGNRLPKSVIRRYSEMPPDEIRKLCSDLEAQLNDANEPCRFRDLGVFRGQQLRVRLRPDIPLEKITSIALMVGTSANNLSLLSPIDDKLLKVFLNNETNKSSVNPDGSRQRYCKTRLVLYLLDHFAIAAGIPYVELLIRLPKFNRKYEHYNEAIKLIHCLQDVLNPKKVQCQTCGDFVNASNARQHLQTCKLEKSTCNCGVMFKTTREKRKHMLLNHSSKKHFGCPDCNYVSSKETAVANHINWYHGKEGVVEICDICGKDFKSKSNLQSHKFTHKRYECEYCKQEIFGSASYKLHLVKFHAHASRCHKCGRFLKDKKQLDKHMKIKHPQFL